VDGDRRAVRAARTADGQPMVRLNRAVAIGMARTPQAGLDLLDGIDAALAGHHRMPAVRAHLLELAGRSSQAADQYRLAATRARNTRERDHLVLRAANLTTPPMTLT